MHGDRGERVHNGGLGPSHGTVQQVILMFDVTEIEPPLDPPLYFCGVDWFLRKGCLQTTTKIDHKTSYNTHNYTTI